MKVLIWVVFGLLAALWTGGAWLVTAVIDCVSGMLGSAQVVDLGQWLLRVDLPAWLRPWIEAEAGWLGMASDLLNALLQAAGSLTPSMATALSWLSWGVWLLWGLGAALLLLLAGGLHVLVGRPARPPAAAAAATAA